MNLLIQALFNFLLRGILVFRHQTSLGQIPVPAMKPFVGYLVPDPSSAVSLAKQIPILPALSEIFHGAWTKVSPEVVWEGVGTRFPHP